MLVWGPQWVNWVVVWAELNPHLPHTGPEWVYPHRAHSMGFLWPAHCGL